MESSLQTDHSACELVPQHIRVTGQHKKAPGRLSTVDQLRSPGRPRILAEGTNVLDFRSSGALYLLQQLGVLPNEHRGP